jgi:serine/threonine-protein kinase HipA
MVHFLEVRLHGALVGTITNLESDYNAFTFDERYVSDPNRPTLSLGFLDADGNLSLPERIPRVRLLPFFANLLPEGHLRKYLADQARVNQQRDFPFLWLLGEDLPGAVVASHQSGAGSPPQDSVIPQQIEADPRVLKFSLAGVQLKFSAIAQTEAGLTIPVHGKNGDWLVKMPSATYDKVPENEYAMLTFARALGIDVPEIELIESTAIQNMPPQVRTDLGRALAVKRFDRVDKRRVHIEDFNQIYNQYPGDKYDNVSYDNILSNIWTTLGEAQTREFVRRLIFNIGIGNADMHLKNWSVIYPDGKTPQLSPAYDYVSTIAYIENDVLALNLARTKQWSDISYDRLERFARRAKVPRGIVLDSAREMVARMRDTWPSIKGEVDAPSHMISKIGQQFERVPIFNGDHVTPAGATADTTTRQEIA